MKYLEYLSYLCIIKPAKGIKHFSKQSIFQNYLSLVFFMGAAHSFFNDGCEYEYFDFEVPPPQPILAPPLPPQPICPPAPPKAPLPPVPPAIGPFPPIHVRRKRRYYTQDHFDNFLSKVAVI